MSVTKLEVPHVAKRQLPSAIEDLKAEMVALAIEFGGHDGQWQWEDGIENEVIALLAAIDSLHYCIRRKS
jgi:hypothetical protein